MDKTTMIPDQAWHIIHGATAALESYREQSPPESPDALEYLVRLAFSGSVSYVEDGGVCFGWS